MVAAALAGVFTRNYQHAALKQVGELAARSTGKSTVSARFVAATRARLEELRNRDLSGRRWLVVYVDGFEFAGQTMVGALGVDADGNKTPLGITQGTTENKTVCRDLLTKAVERGLDASSGPAGRGSRRTVSSSPDATNEPAFTPKAKPGPARAMRPPASGAKKICEMTAADQSAELAPTMSASSWTTAGRTLAAAGLKKTDRADSPKAAAYRAGSSSCHTTRLAAMTARPTSASSITRRRGYTPTKNASTHPRPARKTPVT